MTVPLSILDLAIIDEGETARDSFASSLALAQEAEKLGYTRIWYAEHHNMPTIASSATSVLIGYIAAHTQSIRLGAGGVMLPNHAPLTIAEQFGTLETLFPGRIDLGLGRAPGTDQKTLHALRRDHMSSDSFPQDVQELQGYLSGNTLIPGINATPGAGTNVPLYILGSSLFGAKLAAALGLPYSFASHFAPQALQDAVTIYRRDFKPSAQLAEPYVIAGVNVVAAETTEEAQQMFADSQRRRVTQLFGRDRTFTDEEADAILQSPGGQQVKQMGRYSAVGNPEEVRDYLDWFTGHAQADELIVATQTATLESRLRSFQLLADAALPVRA
ncbi:MULTISPECIES: LLM class flavin-dependent oxidoreductase [Arthrobacter]|uniref:LLM class flavin-dependent oxidoreductase n=1 Tax=Arthrobacter TaxID=1663 RepID=UPI002105616B|nr:MULTISPECIES: LLM class flavin-dependent oxidoreductase [Arthrobacter]MCQ1954216.1 LLM class flavin-dependent oxidoreductase [Arthrobacter sp. zg-Y238]MCQ1957092.1 LLM class flavin-dependent oxidoreductase [Arthrobacter jinronghuae]MCQ1996417.1 LLM class flavin-dependent oxidoreductase [Arthrobacter sp. zg-Y1171]UWX82544.1 LLM class flavin-dependent oxidoreductase [Arthrobacter sp. zg-Y1171]